MIFGELFVTTCRIGHLACCYPANGRGCVLTTAYVGKMPLHRAGTATYAEHVPFKVAPVPWEHRKLQPRCSTKKFRRVYKFTRVDIGISSGGTKLAILRQIMNELY